MTLAIPPQITAASTMLPTVMARSRCLVKCIKGQTHSDTFPDCSKLYSWISWTKGSIFIFNSLFRTFIYGPVQWGLWNHTKTYKICTVYLSYLFLLWIDHLLVLSDVSSLLDSEKQWTIVCCYLLCNTVGFRDLYHTSPFSPSCTIWSFQPQRWSHTLAVPCHPIQYFL